MYTYPPMSIYKDIYFLYLQMKSHYITFSARSSKNAFKFQNATYLHIRNFSILYPLLFCTALYYSKIHRRNFRGLKIVSEDQKRKKLHLSKSLGETMAFEHTEPYGTT